MRTQFVLTIIALTLLLQREGLSQEDKSVGNLRIALGRYKDVEISADVTLRKTRGEEVEYEAQSSVLLRRSGGRVFCSHKELFSRSGQSKSSTRVDSIAFENGDVLCCQAGLDDSLNQVEGVTDTLAFVLDSQQLSGKPQVRTRESIIHGLNDKATLCWTIGYFPLEDYLVDCRVSSPNDSGFVIKSSSEFGILQLETSAERGWLPHWIKISKQRQHKTVGGVSIRKAYSGTNISSVDWTCSAFGFVSDQSGSGTYPERMSVIREEKAGSKVISRTETTISIDHVNFSPAFSADDFQPTVSAPVDFPVGILNAPHLPYRWNGSEVVTGIPKVRDDIKAELIVAAKRRKTLWNRLVIATLVSVGLFVGLWRLRSR